MFFQISITGKKNSASRDKDLTSFGKPDQMRRKRAHFVMNISIVNGAGDEETKMRAERKKMRGGVLGRCSIANAVHTPHGHRAKYRRARRIVVSAAQSRQTSGSRQPTEQ